MQVIQANLFVVVVAAVAQRIDFSHGSGSGKDLAVGIVFIACNRCTAGIDQADDITLEVENVVINCAVVFQGKGPSVGIVDEVQNRAGVILSHQPTAVEDVVIPGAVDSLARTRAVFVGREGDGVGAVRRGQQPLVLTPGEGPPGAVVVAGGIPGGIVGDGLAVIGCQQIPPLAAAVGVGVMTGVSPSLGKPRLGIKNYSNQRENSMYSILSSDTPLSAGELSDPIGAEGSTG